MMWTADQLRSHVESISRAEYSFADTFAEPPEDLDVLTVGGGTILRRRGVDTVRQLHIVPHGGDRLPKAAIAAMQGLDVDTVAEAVFLNRDNATSELAKRLAKAIASEPSLSGVALAFFDFSRIALDANRILAADQVPEKPYFTDIAMRRYLDSATCERLRQELLTPWLDAIHQLIVGQNISTLFHHHSFDTRGQSAIDHDLDPFALRPHCQFFRRRPDLDEVAASSDRGLIETRRLEPLKTIALRALQEIDPEAEVREDFPLVVPPMPFKGCVVEGGMETPQHVVYEVRKDLLRGQGISHWAEAVLEMSRHCLETG